jgi:hypothetical protein
LCEGYWGESRVVREAQYDGVVVADIVLCEVRAVSKETISVIETGCVYSEVRSEAEEKVERRV